MEPLDDEELVDPEELDELVDPLLDELDDVGSSGPPLVQAATAAALAKRIAARVSVAPGRAGAAGTTSIAAPQNGHSVSEPLTWRAHDEQGWSRVMVRVPQGSMGGGP